MGDKGVGGEGINHNNVQLVAQVGFDTGYGKIPSPYFLVTHDGRLLWTEGLNGHEVAAINLPPECVERSNQ